MPVPSQVPPEIVKSPLIALLSAFTIPRNVTMPLPVSTSRPTVLPMMKLPDDNVPGLIVPVLKQDVLKVTEPVIP